MGQWHKLSLGKLALAFCLFISFNIYSQEYRPVEKGSKVEFTFQRGKDAGGQKYKSSTQNITGHIKFDPAHLPQASFDLSIPVNALKSANSPGDFDIKGPEFFFASKYPAITLKSVTITQDRPGGIVYILNGLLSIKGITKPVRVQFTAIHSSTGYMFRGLLQFNRKTFRLGDSGNYDDYVSAFMQINTVKK